MSTRTAFAACRVGLLLGGLLLTGIGCGSASDARLPDQYSKQIRSTRPQPRDEFEKSKDAPINADTHFAAGQLAETQEAGAKAEEQYKLALELDPHHRGSLFRLGVMYAKQRRFTESLEAWNRYIKATDGDAAGYANLGFCLELAGRGAEAEAAYLKGIRNDPSNAPVRVNYGLMLARNGRMNEAMLEMQTVLTPSEVHYNLASVHETQGQFEQAKAEYRKALASDPQMKEAEARLDAMH